MLTLTDRSDFPRVVPTWLPPADGRAWWWAALDCCPVCLLAHRYGQPSGPGRRGWLRSCHGRPFRLMTDREARRG